MQHLEREGGKMSKSTSVYTRIEPEIKAEAEGVLNELGIPMSQAIHMFLRQVVLQKGLPFDVKLPENKPLEYETLSTDDLQRELEKGLLDLKEGRVNSASKVAERMANEYGRDI